MDVGRRPCEDGPQSSQHSHLGHFLREIAPHLGKGGHPFFDSLNLTLKGAPVSVRGRKISFIGEDAFKERLFHEDIGRRAFGKKLGVVDMGLY
jgi:hypothetical protein